MTRYCSALRTLLATVLLLAGVAEARTFTSAEIAGRWESQAPAYDERNKLFGSHVFELHGTQWSLLFTASADAAGQQKLFSVRIGASGYTLGKPVAGLPGAMEGDFERGSVFVTAHAQPMADLFTGAKCGNGAWVLGVEQDVSADGCAFVPSRSACPRELDIVVFDGTTLSFGERSGDLCRLPRPVAASAVRLARKPVFAMIQARITDPGAFFGRYVPGHVPSVQQYGGKFVQTLRAVRPVSDPKLQGTLPGQMFIVQEWPSTMAFDAWWSSSEYAPWSAIRAGSAEVQLTLTTAVGK